MGPRPFAARFVTPAVAGLGITCAACAPATTSPVAGGATGPGAKPVGCTVAGPTLTVAENVYGGEVVAIARPDGGFDVVVVDQIEPCLHVGFSKHLENDGTVLGPCPRHESPRVTSKDGSQTYLVRQFKGDDKLSHIALGYVRYEWTTPLPGVPREVHATDVWQQLPSVTPNESNGESSPTIATYGETGFFVAWVADETVLGFALTASARPAMAPIDLAPQDTGDIGPPSVAFTHSGHGLVAFTASTPDGVHAFATPVTCSL
jgi:hypothetical protein